MEVCQSSRNLLNEKNMTINRNRNRLKGKIKSPAKCVFVVCVFIDF